MKTLKEVQKEIEKIEKTLTSVNADMEKLNNIRNELVQDRIKLEGQVELLSDDESIKGE